MAEREYSGVLLIGDPHLEGRQPGFRKDDYPNAILGKLQWCLGYAEDNHLLPAILGDLFDKPRDNPNWLIVRLLDLLRGEILGLYGNHDVHYNPELTDDDSLSLLVKSGRIRLLAPTSHWQGSIAGRDVVIGGSSYRQDIPKRLDVPSPAGNGSRPFVLWLTHHDILIPGYDEGRIRPREIEGVDLIVNGHIHRHLDDVCAGSTRWLTPGNISRRSRSDASRSHRPAVLHVAVTDRGFDVRRIEVPHRPFDEVFHEAVVEGESEANASAFVAGLAELQARRTASGAGVLQFLEQNQSQFESDVAQEIMSLAREVTNE